MIRRLLVGAVVVVMGMLLVAATAPPAEAAWKPATARASCYGPGLYGNSTANGTVLTTRTRGIAHRSIPLGTPVILASGSNATLTRVIDRGPFVAGRDIDVTAATARDLGYSSCRVFGVRTIVFWRNRR